MDLIHDRANKFMHDVRKKKSKVVRNAYKDNKDQVKQDAVPIADLSNCFYCEKVFFNSKFLMRHILRRHSEGLVALYKRGMKGEYSDNPDDMKHLRSYIESQFLSLKNELKVVKQAVAGKSSEIDTETSKDNIDNESQENACNISENDNKISEDILEVISDEIKNISERLREVESNNQSVNNTVEQLGNVLKTDVLLKQDMKEHMDINNVKILRIQESQLHELRQILLKDFQSIVSKQLYDNNFELKTQISEVKHKLKQLCCDIAATNKRIDTPDFMKAIEEKYEQQLNVLITSMKHNSRVPNKLKSKPVANHMAGEKISDHNKANKRLTRRKGKQVSVVPQILTNEINFLLEDKLSYYGVISSTSKMPSAEYDAKSKIINLEKKHLTSMHPSFPEIYNNFNMLADHKVNLKLHNRKSRKVKFSEPLKSSISAVNNSVSNDEKFQNEQYLGKTQDLTTVNNPKSPDHEYENSASRQKHEYIPEGEHFLATDLNGGGDCSQIYSCRQNHGFEEELSVRKFVSEFKNSATVNNTPKPKKNEIQTALLEGASFPIKSVSEFKNSATVNSTPKSIKNNSQTDSLEGMPSSIKSFSDFKTSCNDSQESKKSGSIDSENSYSLNPLSSSSKKSYDWRSVEIQNSHHMLKDYSKKNLGIKKNCGDNSDVSEISVESLSSWED